MDWESTCRLPLFIGALRGKNATEVADHALDQLIHRLKIKIAKDGYKIETLRGRGHSLV